MILCTDIPFQSWYFNDFYQVALWVASHAHHAVLLVFLLELIVEFVAMAMTFLNVLLFIYREDAGTLFQYTFVCTEAHGSTHVGDVFLFLHDVDDIVWSLFVHLS